MRRKLVVANWKMHGSSAEIEQLLPAVQAGMPPLVNTDVAICPPFVYLATVQHYLASGGIGLGAQNVAASEPGAYTGEVAASMLADCGCRVVIVGHSERRALYGETSATVANKAGLVLKHGMTPVVCVGESLEEREAEATLRVVGSQIDALLADLNRSRLREIVIAYEPVWAIGTGRTATPAQAQAVHRYIRTRLEEFDPSASSAVRIIYGGSVNADNAGELFAQADIDGGLVGGASLKAQEFTAICGAAER